MIVRILAVGGPGKLLAGSIQEFETRARRYWRLEVHEVDAGKGGTRAQNVVQEEEARRLFKKVSPGGALVALTRKGRGMSSPGLARFLQQRAVRSVPHVTFVLGGAHGLSEEFLDKASLRLSLSPLTLPHDLARLVLMEQIYRAGTILKGEPYHKGAS